MLTKNDLQSIKQAIKDETDPINKRLGTLNKEVRKLRKDINTTIKVFDNDITDTKLRVDRIEDHLHLSPMKVG
ncbi:MAG: hypothetical protein WC489_04095 [Patescibacteria group bacterium]